MKKSFIALSVLLIITAISCSKKSGSPMVYSVNGLSDISIPQYRDTTFFIVTSTLYSSGPQEAATLTISDLPSGVTVTPTTTSGTPTFASTFTFHANVPVSGTYPVTVTASSASTGTKKYKFNIIVTPVTQLSYTFSSLPDITIPQYANVITSIPFTATYVSGYDELVTVTPASLPANVTMDSSISGTPTFSSAFHMHSAINTAGTYPVTVNASSSSTGTQAHTFNVIVTPSSDCASEITGTYTTNTTCTSYSGAGTGPGTDAITSTGANSMILDTQFGIGVLANLNCSAGTLAVMGGTHNADLFISAGGAGTFGPNTITVNYTITGSINTTCTTTYTR